MIKLLRFIALFLSAVTGCIILLGLSVYVVSATVNTYQYHFGFDQADWLAMGQAASYSLEPGVVNGRKFMIPDLVAHHLRSGMSRTAVYNLLGPPEQTLMLDSTTGRPRVLLEYGIYKETSYNSYLDVEFVQGRMTRAWDTRP